MPIYPFVYIFFYTMNEHTHMLVAQPAGILMNQPI